MEKRVFGIIEAAGGRAIAEPSGPSNKGYRPDLLAWLGNQDPELLDPTVIEVKRRVTAKEKSNVESQVLKFLQSTGIRTAFILTLGRPPQSDRKLSPYVYWLDIDKFETLALSSKLGNFVRETRNRLMHGAR